MNKMLISKKLITLFLLLVNVFAYSQFVTTGTATSNSLYSGGNIGVGFTTLPVFGTNKFIVTGNSLFTGNTTVNGTGQFANLGLGVLPNTAFRLNVTGNSLFTGTTAFTGNTTVSGTSQIANLGLGVLPNTAFRLNVTGNSLFTGTTQTTGNVGIGIAPSATLSTKLSLASGIQGLSGLQFSNLTSAFVPTSSTNKFLTVDASGKVVLLNTTQTSGGTTITAGANITTTGSPTTGYTISSPSQVLSQSGNTVSLSNGGGSVTLPTSTDSQTLSVAGNQLSISNGNTVTLPTISNTNLYNSNGTITNSNGTSGRNVNLNNNFLKFSGNEPTTNTNNTITISPFGNTSNPNSDNRSIQEIKSDKYYFPNFDGIGLNTNKVYGSYENSSGGFENRLTNGFYDSMAWLQVSYKSGTFYGNNKVFSSIGALSYLINPLGGKVGIGLDEGNPLGTVTDPTAVLHTKGSVRLDSLGDAPSTPDFILGTDANNRVFQFPASSLTSSNVNIYNSNGTITNPVGYSGRFVNLNNNILQFSNSNNAYFGFNINPNPSICASFNTIYNSGSAADDVFILPNTNKGYTKIFGNSFGSSVGVTSLTTGVDIEKSWLQSGESNTLDSSKSLYEKSQKFDLCDEKFKPLVLNPLGGFVGIGLGQTVVPTAQLHTKGSVKLDNLGTPPPAPISILGTDANNQVFQFPASSLTPNNVNIYTDNGDLQDYRTVNLNQKALTFLDNQANFSNRLIIGSEGNVSDKAINVIESTTQLAPNLGGGGFNRNELNFQSNFYSSKILKTEGVFEGKSWIQTSGENYYINHSVNDKNYRFDTFGPGSYLINPLGGNVGIGLDVNSTLGTVTDPTAVLHTLGKLRFQNLPNNEKPLYVLGTDDQGNVFEYDPSQFGGGATQDAWLLNGNANTIPGTLAGQNFLGTTDAKDLVFAVNSDEKFRITQTGRFKFFNNSIGPTWEKNIFIGGGNDNISSQSSNVNYANVAVGLASLMSNTTGYANTATGYNTLKSNTTGRLNAAFGINSMFNNTIGLGNVSMGHNSLYENINGNTNTAIGNQSLVNNKNGSNNTAIGSFAGNNLIQGNNNIFIGVGTLSSNSNISNELNIGNWIYGKNGQIAIGSFTNLPQSFITNNDYQLIVKKGIRTEKVRVDIASVKGWADYVFAKDYSLLPLKDLEKFIKINGHLPNIPKAEEVVKEGIDLGAMDAKLLEKIEELTIHTIELNKKNEALEKEKIKQAKLIDDLAKRLEKLEKNTKQ